MGSKFSEMNQKEHWEKIYETKPLKELGWYKPHLQTSLNWIKDLDLKKDTPIIDVGGGASTLVDDLLDEGFQAITMLDISEKALSLVKSRLGKKAEQVTWLTADITSVDLPENHFEMWHDRAVFHFFTAEEENEKYRANLWKSVKPGGYLIISTFSPEAPPKCSGLPVQRYGFEKLVNVPGEEFDIKRFRKEQYVTPGGVEQMYLYCLFQRKLSVRENRPDTEGG